MPRRLPPKPDTPWRGGRPVLLDLFCGAGGASMGYYQAGFDVWGIDIVAQPNYPFDMWTGNALSILAHLMDGKMISPFLPWDRVAAIHASPPCQQFSQMTHCRPGLREQYPDLIAATRQVLSRSGKPWVIENVPNAPLRDPITLCGQMFGLSLYRHRLFETSFDIEQPPHPQHLLPSSRAGHWTPGTIMSVSGHIAPISHARKVMEVDWCTREELAEAIPPRYTRFIGQHILTEEAS